MPPVTSPTPRRPENSARFRKALRPACVFVLERAAGDAKDDKVVGVFEDYETARRHAQAITWREASNLRIVAVPYSGVDQGYIAGAAAPGYRPPLSAFPRLQE